MTDEVKKHSYKNKELPIKQVTIYNDSAIVVRTVSVPLVKGEQYVHIQDLTRFVHGDSIRVSGVGSATILEITYKEYDETIHPDSKDLSSKKEFENEKKLLEEEQGEITQMEYRLQREKDFLVKYASSVVNVSKTDKKVTKLLSGDITTGISGFMEFYQKELKRIDESFDKFTEKKASIQKSFKEINEKMSKLIVVDTIEKRREAIIKLDGYKDGEEAKLEFSYRVGNCFWTPFYDVKVTKKQFQIHYFGTISQTTGEDWSEAKISLSTADPQIGAEPPKLTTLSVGWYTPPQIDYYYQVSKARKEYQQQAYNVKESYQVENDEEMEEQMDYMPQVQSSSLMKKSKSKPMSRVLQAPPKPVEPPKAKMDVGAISTNFVIQRSATIPSDGANHKVTIGIIELKSEFSYYTVPKLDTNVYLKVKAINDSEFPLLSGVMNVFFDGNFIANGVMKAVSLKEEFESYLGVDPGVKVEYRPVKKTTETSGLISRTTKMSIERRTVIKNTKDIPIHILVTDQYPKSTDERIKVDLVEPQLPSESNELKDVKKYESVCTRIGFNADTGNMEWDMVVQPNKEILIPYFYNVSWPAGSGLDNTNL